MKATKKPITIEYFPVDAALKAAAHEWKALPKWLADAYEKGLVVFENTQLSIHTLEGWVTGQKGDLIIQGVKGELYPCKPDIFSTTYDLE